MQRILKLVLPAIFAAGLIVGMPGVANANPSGVVVFPIATATTSPLTFPGLPLTGTGTWSLSASATACVSTSIPASACGGISISGSLGPVAGVIGPFCGATSGVGSADAAGNPGQASALGHTGITASWASTIGSVFPVTVTGTGHSAVVVLVQVSPANPTDCLTGATTFNVRIVAAVL